MLSKQNLFSVCTAVALSSCGLHRDPEPPVVGPPGSAGSSCHVSDVSEGALVECDDGTSVLVRSGTNGSDGTAGANGSDGQDGAPGANGAGAVLSSGPVGAPIANNLSECHHDYLYLSNGWLLFRHQANGASDQGIGSTGFNVWNVDTASFQLVSEVGAHPYCTLTFNKQQQTLTILWTEARGAVADTINLTTGVITQ